MPERLNEAIVIHHKTQCNMKIFQIFFVLIFLANSFTAAADDAPKSKFQMKSEMTRETVVNVRLFNLQELTTTMRITDLDGKVSYFQEIIRQHNGFTQNIDMDKMADGRYLLQIEQGDSVKQQVIVISDRQVMLSDIAG